MKKWISTVLCMVLLTHPFGVWAEDVFVLPKELQCIEDEAFYGITSLHEVVLAEGVLSIDQKAFAFSSITRIHLPASIEYIADDAFLECHLEFVKAEGDYGKKWCADHGIRTDTDDSYAGEPFVIF